MENYIEIPNRGKYNLAIIIDTLEYLRPLLFNRTTWLSSPALVDKSGSIKPYIVQKYNDGDFTILENGWTHDHCEICVDSIRDCTVAYNSENDDWICTSCYHLFIEPKNIDSLINDLKL